MKVLWIAIVFCAMLLSSADAQHPQHGDANASDTTEKKTVINLDDVRMSYNTLNDHRLLGDNNLGSFTGRSLNFSASSGRTTILYYSARWHDYSSTDLSRVDKNVRSEQLGFSVPIKNLVELRYTKTDWVVHGTDSSIGAAGGYIVVKPNRAWRFEVAGETFFGEPPEQYYFTGR